MHLLLKSAHIVDPSSPHHGKVADVRIEDGTITAIAQDLAANDAEVVEAENLHVSPGWVDMHVNFRDPGHEYKEDLHSGLKAAARGGFTGVTLMPSTYPPLSSKADIEYVKNKAAGHAVDLYPTGTLSQNREGKEMSEMFDMQQAGAIAFTDDKRPVVNPSLMTRALLYTRNFNGLAISFPHDSQMGAHGKMNEGATSTRLGLHGMPTLAEDLQVSRDINLAEYTGARLHFCTISSGRSVDLIREAKAKGLPITAEVAAHNLLLDDSQLEEYDTNLKVFPPLRTNEDIAALKAGLKDGTIDAISSDHTPEDIEHKDVEFDQASFGIASIETAFASANEAVQGTLSTDELVSKFAVRPREILGLAMPSIAEGEKANLTLFDPTGKWTPDRKEWSSRSRNTPFFGRELTGKVLGIINHGQYLS